MFIDQMQEGGNALPGPGHVPVNHSLRGYTWIQILGPLQVCEALLTLLNLSVP